MSHFCITAVVIVNGAAPSGAVSLETDGAFRLKRSLKAIRAGHQGTSHSHRNGAARR